MINSLKYAKQLEQVGVSREQAEAHLQILVEIMETNLATREDLKDLKIELKQDLQLLRQELKSDVIQSEQRMTIKLGTIVSVAIGIAVAVTKVVG